MISRIAIVNRGEPAVRLLRAVAEWNRERGADVKVIALATHAERRAMFVRLADEVQIIAPRPGGAVNPYLDLDVLGEALTAARADAVWVGWGFVAERPEFADLCAAKGITFVGPSGAVMRKLGDKIGSKLLAEEAGVPVSAWSGGPVITVEDALAHGERIGYPLVVKATAGGGGRGIRFVDTADDLPAAIESAQGEALRSFGDGTVFMERLVGDARHIEVQIVADAVGNVWALGVRDCSVQRRRQKVLEESRSVALSLAAEDDIKAAAVRLVRLAGYCNAGTVEFLYQPESGDVAFLEVNTRLQVEHPVTEETTGVDIVKLQLHVADGGTLEGDPPPTKGHAIEARLNAEDPDRGFAPAPGTVAHLQLPAGPGIRVDSGVATGDVIPSEYDSMIAKIIAVGRDRHEALARLSRALSETTVVVTGGTTNKSFLLELLDRPQVRSGDVDTGWLDRLTSAPPDPRPHGGLALVAAAVAAAREEEEQDRATFFAMAARGRPQAPTDRGHSIEFRVGGRAYEVGVNRVGLHRFVVVVDGASLVLESDRMGEHLSRVTIGDRSFRVLTVVDGASTLVEVDGVAHRISRDEGGLVRSPAPGLVVGLAVQPGDEVAAGATVAVLEAMKMETAVVSPSAGRVREVLVTANVQVAAGAPLVRIDVLDAGDGAAVGEQIDVSDLVAAAATGPRPPATDSMSALLLGLDYNDQITGIVLDRYAEDTAADPAGEVDAEVGLLNVFADVLALARNRRAGRADETAHNEREHLLAYLGSLEIARERVPPSFEPKLRKALAHYGVDSLEHTHELHVALYRLYLAIDEAGSHIPVIEAILGRLETAVPTEEVRRALDRLIGATQLRFPTLGDRARRLRTRLFDVPLLARRQDAAYERVFELLDALDHGDPAVDHDAVMAELGMCPYPLVGLLPARFDVTEGRPEPVVEAIIRRYYRGHAITGITAVLDEGLDVVVARHHDADGVVADVVAVAAPDGALGRAMEILRRHVGSLPADGELLLVGTEAVDEPAVLDARVRQELARLPDGLLRRMAVSFVDHTGGTWTTLSYVPDDESPGGWQEQTHLRGTHPMIAERLHLWRFSEFHTERVPSAAEVTVLRCTARQNPSDQRYVVLAEVRDLTLVRDEQGEIVALPEVEHALEVAVNELRAVADGETAPDWNRVVLYMWPDLTVALDELAGVSRKMAPLTDGAGLEQVLVYANIADEGGVARPVVIRFSVQPGTGFTVALADPPTWPMAPRDDYVGNVMRSRQRGAVYPFELVPMITQVAGCASGTFTELDLDASGALVPVDRPPGGNTAAIIAGLVRTPTVKHPEGIERVALFGDPLKALGSLAQPECERVIAAVELARRRQVPIEWFALSAGAKISMDSGTENMDWIARALRSIVDFTQGGGEINIIVAGINVGAQPYWNAEATMLMHTKGILVMTPDGAMVLTGKQALDYSGGVSAEDNFGIGGYDRIMGPNGQAQYWAPDLAGAVDVLFRHYEHSYVAPGESAPRRTTTADPVDRDVRAAPHPPDSGLATVGDVFSESTNPGRKKPFDIRAVMRAVADHDHELLERWADMRDADSAVVVDAHLGGFPVTLIGIESKPLPRFGLLNADGPDQWSAGTLFPLSSKKVARGINAASGSRPLVILANLSGFDGSPESLRRVQLEYGAEIGRAIVNFDGPIVFCVISRYHGGAFVVFSATLHDNMQVLALEGSFASVIGGAPAAAVVFAGEVNRRARDDERVRAATAAMREAVGPERGRLQAELDRTYDAVRSEVLGRVAAEFDAVHSIQRAQEIGSVHRIISAERLRPELIDAVEHGMARAAT